MPGNQPKRHHYLAEVYQQRFTNIDGLLWVFDRKSKEYRLQQPRDTAVEHGYYTYHDKNGVKHYDIEEMFSTIEGHANLVIQKVEDAIPLNKQDKEVLANFVAWQHLRVPEYQKGVEESGAKMAQTMMRMRFSSIENSEATLAEYEKSTGKKAAMTAKEAMDYVYSNKYSIVHEREYSIKMMLKMWENTVPIFLHANWQFLLSPKSTSFITSDNPFALVPPPDYDPRGLRGVGLLTEGAKKIMPLSPRICLSMGDPGQQMISGEITREGVRNVNKATAINSYRFLIAKEKTHLQHIVKTTKIDRKPMKVKWVETYSPFDKDPDERL